MKHIATVYVAITIGLLSLASCGAEEEYDATGIFDATTVTVSAETTGKLCPSMSVKATA